MQLSSTLACQVELPHYALAMLSPVLSDALAMLCPILKYLCRLYCYCCDICDCTASYSCCVTLQPDSRANELGYSCTRASVLSWDIPVPMRMIWFPFLY